MATLPIQATFPEVIGLENIFCRGSSTVRTIKHRFKEHKKDIRGGKLIALLSHRNFGSSVMERSKKKMCHTSTEVC